MAKNQYVWDPAKERSNIKKHQVDFETAAHVFNDPFAQTEQDQIVNGEYRWRTMGLVEGCWLLVVAHTVREDADGTEIIRIISARRAEPKEEKCYEQNCPL